MPGKHRGNIMMLRAIFAVVLHPGKPVFEWNWSGTSWNFPFLYGLIWCICLLLLFASCFELEETFLFLACISTLFSIFWFEVMKLADVYNFGNFSLFDFEGYGHADATACVVRAVHESDLSALVVNFKSMISQLPDLSALALGLIARTHIAVEAVHERFFISLSSRNHLLNQGYQLRLSLI